MIRSWTCTLCADEGPQRTTTTPSPRNSLVPLSTNADCVRIDDIQRVAVRCSVVFLSQALRAALSIPIVVSGSV